MGSSGGNRCASDRFGRSFEPRAARLSGVQWLGGPGWIRTTDRRIMSPRTNPCLADEEVIPEVEYGIIPSSAERWCLEMLSFDMQNSKEVCTSTQWCGCA